MAYFHSPQIVKDGLVLLLDAANTKSYPGSGTTWFDRSGNINNGTLTNGPTFSSANGGSIVFDGVDDLCRTDVNVSNLNNFFSVGIWFTLTSTTSSDSGAVSKRLISADQSSGSTKWCIGITPTRQFLFAGSGGTERTLNFTIELNTPYFVVLTHNVSTYSLFLNGVNQIRNDTSNIASPNFGKVSIACRPNSVDRLWTGSVFSSMFYTRILTDEEVLQNYNATKGRFGL
jgi:hypothetical protein